MQSKTPVQQDQHDELLPLTEEEMTLVSGGNSSLKKDIPTWPPVIRPS